jgi:DNA repair exonuclease SbcCD ATPase subunit
MELNRLRKDHGESTAAAKGYRERAEAAEKMAGTLRERLEEVRKGKDNAASTIARQAEEIHSLRQDLYKARDIAEAGDRAVTEFERLTKRCNDAEQKLGTAIQEREALLDCVQEQQRTIESTRGQAGSSLSLAEQLSKREQELEILRRESAALKHRFAELEIQCSDLKHNAEPLVARARQADELESVQQELLRTISAQAAQLQQTQDALIVAQGKEGGKQNAALLDRKRLERAERLLGQYRALEEELVRRTGDPFFDALLLQRRMDAISGPAASSSGGMESLPLLPGGILGTLGKRRKGRGSAAGVGTLLANLMTATRRRGTLTSLCSQDTYYVSIPA